jgi:hypothetical protein
MYRSSGRRRTAARITGWGLVAIAYVTVLAFASDIPAGPAIAPAAAAADAARPAAAEAATTKAAGVLAAAPAETGMHDVQTTVTAPAGAASEEPMVTLALAAGMVGLAGLAYGVHEIHGRLARRAARRRDSVARLVARQITTLM